MILAPSVPPAGLPLLTGAQAGAADEAAVAAGDSWDGLLARAGGALARAVVDVLHERTGGVYGRRVLVVAGKGDNGGDGWVCAARLRDRGAGVTVLAVHGTEVETSDHSGRARAAWLDSGGDVVDLDGHRDRLARRPTTPDVVVDCVLGTGAHGAPRGEAAPAVAHVRELAQRAAVVACDVPSGVDADTGAVADPELVVDAVVTVTFGAAKRGLVLHPGARRAGAVVVADLGPRWELPPVPPTEQWHALGQVHAVPHVWRPDDDKRSRGRVAVLAGSRRYGGAVALTAGAALRTGAGLVTVATSADPVPVLALDPGLMVRSIPAADDGTGGPAADAVDTVLEVLDDATAVAVGPGLGHQDSTRPVVEAVLGAPVPDGGPRTVVLDADGLNVFRHDATALRDSSHLLVLTPHVRELARLLDVDVGDVADDRAGAAAELASLAGAVVVAKGPSTLVVATDAPTAVSTSGGPALGTGGTGDVLAGMLAAGLAGRRPGADVAGVAAGVVHLHGLVGQRAGRAAGGRATASDLLDHLPAVLAELVARHRGTDHGW